MRCRFLLPMIFATVTYAGVTAFADEPTADQGWRRLPLITDGEVDPNWVQIGWGKFVVDDDRLRTECDERGMGLLLYKAQPFGNCQIRVVYKPQDNKSNSGVFVRIDPKILEKVSERPAAVQRDADGTLAKLALEQMMKASLTGIGPWYAVHHGYEVQICNAADPEHRTGAIYSLVEAKPLPPAPADGWRTMIITLDGQKITVQIDGKQISTFESIDQVEPENRQWYEPKRAPKRPVTGYLGLQNHDPGDVVFFKEVSVRPLRKRE